jgi:hypothetical protein
MDFPRTELLNPILTVVRNTVVDDIDPYFDNDNDLIFSRNGAVLTFANPIEDFQWIDMVIENMSVNFPLVTMNMRRNNGGSALAAAQALSNFVNSSKATIRLFDVGRVEELLLTCNINSLIAVKSISVAGRNSLYKKQSDLVNVVPTMAGWTYDATRDRYFRDFGDLENVTCSVAATIGLLDFVHVKAYMDANVFTPPMQVVSTSRNKIENTNTTCFGFTVEWDITGNVDENTFPNNITIIGPPGGKRIYVEFRKGTFPIHSASIFGGESSSLPTIV